MTQRTTIRLDDELLGQARAYADRHDRSLTSVLEEALRRLLADPAPQGQRQRVDLPGSTAGGGTQPSVDLADTATLLDLLDGGAAT